MNLKKEDLEKYMALVLEEAKLALKEGEIPIAALIVKDDKILSLTHNKIESLKDATAHAEILAIKEASKKLNNWRLDGTSLFVNVEPCTMCTGAIENARIANVIYGTSEPKTGALGARYDLSLFNPKKIKIISGILEEESKEIIKKTFVRKIFNN
ncbi:MAG: nucleoside deaminase [Bdellovibrionota bacterium]|nr:nucleoside deaminase [Pseudomonadota bacterium]MDY6090975.1 nucleoside deaminase [Bdellovibrionota bacterium]